MPNNVIFNDLHDVNQNTNLSGGYVTNLRFEFSKATEVHLEKIAKLVNLAYRNTSQGGWTTEAHLIGGQRTDQSSLADLLTKKDAVILVAESNPLYELSGCVYLHNIEKKCYLGMLTVAPHLQNHGLGKALVLEGEKYARQFGCQTLEITVISVRTELLAWYERLGFQKTNEIKPFPYDDESFGKPKTPGLCFNTLQKKLIAL
jgi:ribosomal protein S18 acetylase RimI-like enzyme